MNLPVLISAEQIQTRVTEIAHQLNKKYEGQSPIFICILKGGFLFFSDLIKQLSMNLQVDFMQISSYEGKESKEIKFLSKDFSYLKDRPVIIIDDILDTGKTLRYVVEHIQSFHPAELQLITLLKRKTSELTNLPVLTTGFEINDEFVVGYGLDDNEKMRQLGFISWI